MSRCLAEEEWYGECDGWLPYPDGPVEQDFGILYDTSSGQFEELRGSAFPLTTYTSAQGSRALANELFNSPNPDPHNDDSLVISSFESLQLAPTQSFDSNLSPRVSAARRPTRSNIGRGRVARSSRSHMEHSIVTSSTSASSNGDGEVRYVCRLPDCPSASNGEQQTFSRFHDLKRHWNTVHNQSSKSYKCSVAGCKHVNKRSDKMGQHCRTKMHFDGGAESIQIDTSASQVVEPR